MQPGFYPDMPDNIYHSLEGYSKTVLCEVTPFDYWAKRIYSGPKPVDDKEKDHYLLGRLFHCMVLEKSEVVKRYAKNEGLHTNKDGKPVGLRRGTKSYEDWASQNPGVSLISPTMWNSAERMLTLSLMNPLFKKIFDLPGYPESTFIAKCPQTAFMLRVRPDYLIKTDDMPVVDLKTTGDFKASPDKFPWEAYKLHYHVSGALTLDIIERATGKRPSKYYFAVTEKPWPHRAAVWEMTEEGIEAGRRWYQDRLQLFKMCIETGYYPAYVAKDKKSKPKSETYFRFVEDICL